MRETDLYEPVKDLLQRQGYEVKGEVGPCDVMAVRGDEPPVIVELKTSFSLSLVLQGVSRQSVCDDVYLAVPTIGGGRRRQQGIMDLCRRLGLGLMLVRTAPTPFVDVLLDPKCYQPRTQKARRGRLLREFQRRVGDANTGGSTKRPVLTAYRQDALRLAMALDRDGPTKVSSLATLTNLPKAGTMLLRDVYGWFERVDRGIYQITPKGKAALQDWADVLGGLSAHD